MSIGLFSAANLARAAGTQTGTVMMEYGTYGSSATSAGLAFFNLQGSGAKANKPTCNTAGDRWVINLNTPAAKFQMAMLLTAISTGKTASVIGTGDCQVWGDTETVMDIRLNNQ